MIFKCSKVVSEWFYKWFPMNSCGSKWSQCVSKWFPRGPDQLLSGPKWTPASFQVSPSRFQLFQYVPLNDTQATSSSSQVVPGSFRSTQAILNNPKWFPSGLNVVCKWFPSGSQVVLTNCQVGTSGLQPVSNCSQVDLNDFNMLPEVVIERLLVVPKTFWEVLADSSGFRVVLSSFQMISKWTRADPRGVNVFFKWFQSSPGQLSSCPSRFQPVSYVPN